MSNKVIVERRLYHLRSELADTPAPERHHIDCGGLAMTLYIFPSDRRLERPIIPIVEISPPNKPTDCEWDILDAIRAAGRDLTRPKIQSAFDAKQILHGDSTIAHSLAAMVRKGWLTSSRKRTGYCVTDAAPVRTA